MGGWAKYVDRFGGYEIVVYRLSDYVYVLQHLEEVKRFARFAEFVKELLGDERFDWFSTHSALNRWIAQVGKVVYLSKCCYLRLPGEYVSCYKLFDLDELENALELARDFENCVKRVRRMVHNTVNYVVQCKLNDIVMAEIVCEQRFGDAEVKFYHRLTRRDLLVEATVTYPRTTLTVTVDLDRVHGYLAKKLGFKAEKLLPELLLKRTVRTATRKYRELEQELEFLLEPAEQALVYLFPNFGNGLKHAHVPPQ